MDYETEKFITRLERDSFPTAPIIGAVNTSRDTAGGAPASYNGFTSRISYTSEYDIITYRIYADGFVHYFDEGVKISGRFAQPLLIAEVEAGAGQHEFRLFGANFRAAVNKVIGVEMA